MRNFSIYSFIIILSVAFTSCKNDVKENPNSEKTEKGLNETSWETAMKKIDQQVAISDAIANSLYYSKESGESEKLVAFLSQENKILKIEEEFSGLPSESAGRITYYLNQTKPLVTVEMFEDKSGSDGVKFVERISYYDDNGKAAYTKEKRVNYEEDLESVAYQSVALVSLSTDKIFRILNQEGEFQTTFQGIVETESLNYVIVGEPKVDGFTSALRVEFEDHIMKEVYKNPKKYMNKPMRVTFQLSRLQGNFEYQVYTGGSWE